MATVVDKLYDEFRNIYEVLSGASEISLLNAADENFRKALLLCAASHFEHRVTGTVIDFCKRVVGPDILVPEFVKNKAVSRQYHSWFDWEKNNANHFFGLFGQSFKEYMKNLIEVDADVDVSIRAFLEIGRERNRLVHQDFGSFPLEKNSEEIFNLYTGALRFVELLPVALVQCSERNR